MISTPPQDELPFGILELDPTGVVRRYRPEQTRSSATSAAEIIRRNIFTDISAVAQSKELPERLHAFLRSSQPTEKFNLTLHCNDSDVEAQILLVHIYEQSEQGRERLSLVHIRRV